MSADKYVVVATRDGDSWEADVAGVDGAHTWARNLTTLDRYVREVIALALDLPAGAESSLHIEFQYRNVSREFLEAVAIGELRAAIRVEQAALAQHATVVASRLLDQGISARDVSAALHLSPGRVAQIAGQRVRKAS